MSAPVPTSSPSSNSNAAADGAAAVGRAPRKEKAAVVPSAECLMAMDMLTDAFRSTLGLPPSSSSVSSEVSYPEKGGVIKPSREFEHKEKATISLAYPGELSAEQLQSVEDATNTIIKTKEQSTLLPFKLIKPKRTKAKDGYEFTFVIGATGKSLVARTEAEKEKLNSKKVGALAAAGAPAAAAGPTSPLAASAASSSSSSSAPVVAVASKDYVVATTEEIYHELMLASFAKLQLQQSIEAFSAASAASASSAVSPDAIKIAAMLQPSQLAIMLSKDQLKSKPNAEALVNLLGHKRILAALTPAQLESTLSPATQAFFATELMPSLASSVVIFGNEAYTKGFVAAKKGSGGVTLEQLL